LEKTYIFVGTSSATDEKKQDQDPEVSGTDPRIRIHIKMSRIHNTEKNINADPQHW
jgi:hypothetical protein